MKRIARAWISFLIGAVLLSACQSNALRKAGGKVAIEREQMAGQLPTQAPAIVYVTDFALDAEHFRGESGVRGLLPGRLRERAASRLEELPGPAAQDDPVAKAREIVTAMSAALVKSLSANGMPARPLDPAAEPWPGTGWLIGGVFTEVDEGNRIKRAVIGFGRGATRMEAQVTVSDLASRTPTTPFAIFGTLKDPGQLPGAVVTLNPYVAAARFVMEKGATAKDIEKTADQIAGEIVKFSNKIRDEP